MTGSDMRSAHFRLDPREKRMGIGTVPAAAAQGVRKLAPHCGHLTPA